MEQPQTTAEIKQEAAIELIYTTNYVNECDVSCKVEVEEYELCETGSFKIVTNLCQESDKIIGNTDALLPIQKQTNERTYIQTTNALLPKKQDENKAKWKCTNQEQTAESNSLAKKKVVTTLKRRNPTIKHNLKNNRRTFRSSKITNELGISKESELPNCDSLKNIKACSKKVVNMEGCQSSKSEKTEKGMSNPVKKQQKQKNSAETNYIPIKPKQSTNNKVTINTIETSENENSINQSVSNIDTINGGYKDEDDNMDINTSSESDFEESDDEFEASIGVKKGKYKPRRRPQLTEEQKAEKERRSIEKRTCKVCGMLFAFPGGLRNHMRSKHTFEKPYSCDICGEKFTIQSSYSLHKRRHLGIKPHLCNQCGKTFLRRMDLAIHMRIHIPSEDKIRDAKCTFCPKVYTSKINLKKHILTKHTDPTEWKHECTVCGKKLYSATALTHHVRQHNDDRRYKCVICGRGFFTKQNMNIHFRTHSASTAFNCEHCSNGYRSNEALQRHMLKVHKIGEERPVSAPKFFCSVCNEGFRQRARLEQHVELHETGEEEYPFECEKCHRRYKARNYFTIHMLDKHGIKIDESYFKMFHLLQQRSYTGTVLNSTDCGDSNSMESTEYKNASDSAVVESDEFI